MLDRLLASAACGLMLGLAACGGGGGGGVGSTPPPANIAPTPTPTPTPTPPPPPPPPPPGTNFNTAEYQRSNGAMSSGAITAWQDGVTGKGVKIGIVDSGINPSLAEFAGRIDPASRDVAGNRPLGDEDGHGTAVAATAAAARNDAQNVGVAFDATILTLRADDPGTCGGTDGCEFYDGAIAQGVDAARLAGARVINMSLGGSAPGSQLLSAMQRAVDSGIILVISAGNDGEDLLKGNSADPFALIPAQHFPGQVIIAGSVGVASGSGTSLDQISTFSNRAGQGQNWYLGALGYRVRTIDQTGTAFLYSGTSFSAPIISGAVALIAQAFPNMTAAQIVDLLFKTADDLGAAGDDAIYGQGRLNITRAFQPVGTASLAGTETVVTAGATDTDMPEAAGDGGSKGGLGAIILDGYSRAFVMDLARGLRQAETRQPLERALSGRVRGSAVNAGPVSIAMTVAARQGNRGLFDVERLGIGPDDARQSRLVAGSAIARLDSKTKAAFGFSQGAKAIERQLNDAETGAFLIARDVSADPGFQARHGSSFAIRRDLGFAGLTVATEDGHVWQQVKTSATDAPYRWTSISLDRRFGDRTWASLGLSRLDEQRTLLGGRMGPLFGVPGSNSLFLDMEARRDFGNGWAATIMGRRGWTDFAGGRFESGAYSFDLAKFGLVNGRDRLGLRIAQPLRVERGGIAMMLPTSYDYATESETNTLSRLSFTPSGRELDAELSYSTSLGRGWLGANLFARRQPGHIASADADLGAAIRYGLGF
jgi:hypothetical protein